MAKGKHLKEKEISIQAAGKITLSKDVVSLLDLKEDESVYLDIRENEIGIIPISKLESRYIELYPNNIKTVHVSGKSCSDSKSYQVTLLRENMFSIVFGIRRELVQEDINNFNVLNVIRESKLGIYFDFTEFKNKCNSIVERYERLEFERKEAERKELASLIDEVLLNSKKL